MNRSETMTPATSRQVVDEICGDDFIGHDPLAGDPNVAAVKQTIAGYRDAFPDLTLYRPVKVEHPLLDADVWPKLADLGCRFVISTPPRPPSPGAAVADGPGHRYRRVGSRDARATTHQALPRRPGRDAATR